MRIMKLAGLAVAVMLIALGAGCFGPDKDAENLKRVKDYMAALPGSVNATKIEVKGDKLTLTGLKGTMSLSEVGPMAFNVGEIVYEGVDFEASKTPGNKPVAKKVTIKDYSVESSAKEFSSKAVVKQMQGSDLSGDLNAFVKATTQNPTYSGVMLASLGFKAGSVSCDNYTITMNMGFGPIVVRLDHMEGRDAGMLRCGDFKGKGLNVNALGLDMVTVESLGLKKMVMPDILTPTSRMMEQTNGTMRAATPAMDKEFSDALKAAITKEPLVIEGLTVSNMKIRTLTNEVIQLAEADWSAKVQLDKEISVTKNFNGLEIPPGVYAKASPEGEMLAEIYKKPLILSGALDFSTKAEGQGGSLKVNNLRVTEKNLADAQLSVTMGFGQGNPNVPAAPADAENMSLQSAKVMLEDKGLVNLAFALQSKQMNDALGQQSMTVEKMREGSVAQLRSMTAGAKSDVQRKAIEALASLVEKSGRLVIEVAPASQMTMQELAAAAMVNPAILNMKVEFTPAK